jgi:hypothetical protein
MEDATNSISIFTQQTQHYPHAPFYYPTTCFGRVPWPTPGRNSQNHKTKIYVPMQASPVTKIIQLNNCEDLRAAYYQGSVQKQCRHQNGGIAIRQNRNAITYPARVLVVKIAQA